MIDITVTKPNGPIKRTITAPENSVIYTTGFDHHDQHVNVEVKSDGMIMLYLINEHMPGNRIYLPIKSPVDAANYNIDYPDFEETLIEFVKSNANLDRFVDNAPQVFLHLKEEIEKAIAEEQLNPPPEDPVQPHEYV